MKLTPEYRSRFRILKGGKISLVVSALLVGSGMVTTNLHAVGPQEVSGTTIQLIDIESDDYSIEVVSPGITVSDDSALVVNGEDYARISITNNSTITVTGEDAALYGINAFSLGEDSLIQNNTAGVISVTNDIAEAFGISTKTNGFNGSLRDGSQIINAGTITVSGLDYAEGIFVDGDLNDDSLIRNSGTITATTLGGYAYGIDVLGAMIASSIENTSTGVITLSGEDGAMGIAVWYGMMADDPLNPSSITNAGQISVDSTLGDASGILIGSTYASEGEDGFYAAMAHSSIINSGTIDVTTLEGTAYGILLQSQDGEWSRMSNSAITNESEGEIIVSGTQAMGISVGTMIDSTITNAGDIAVSGIDFAVGISSGVESNLFTLYGEDSAIMVNSTILNAAGSTLNVRTSGEDSIALGITALAVGEGSTIQNDGDMVVANEGSGSALGIFTGYMVPTDDASGFSDSLDINMEDWNDLSEVKMINNGSLTVQSSGEAGGGEIMGFASVGMMNFFSIGTNVSILNTEEGVIEVSAEAGGAVGIFNGLNHFSEIRNEGSIEVSTQGEDSMAVGILSYENNSGWINNSGTITVSALGEGSNAVGIQNMVSKYVEEIGGGIANSGTISVEGTIGSVGISIGSAMAPVTNSGEISAKVNGEYDAQGYSIRIDSAFEVNNTYTDSTHYGKLYGNLYVGGILNNDGLVSLPHNAMGEDSAWVADFNNGATGILEIGVLTDGEIENTTYSQLRTDYATFAEGSTIAVNVLEASTGVALLVGERLENVVTAYNALTIDGTLNITDNSALLNFELVTSSAYGEDWLGNGEDGAIHLDIVQGTTIFDSTVAGGGNSPAKAAASALQTIQDNGVQESMTGFFEALNGLETDAQVAAAVLSTAPATNTATSTANNQIMNGIQGIVEMRQNSVMGMSSGDKSLRDQNLWAKVYGSRGSQETKEGINGFDVNAFGIGFGADAEIGAKQRIGAALFYTDADVDVNGVNQKSDVKVYTAMVYGNIPMNANTDFLYQGGYSWQKTETERNVFGIGTANGDYTAKTASLDLKVMKTYPIDKALTLRPLVETTYRHYTSPSYSESGAGGMNLNIEKFTSTQLIMGAGVIAEYKTGKNEKLIADISVGYDLHHEKQSVNASYQGAPSVTFTTNGIDNGGWQYDIGLGYEEANVLGGELNFMYNYQGQGSGFDNHVLSAKYVWKF
jgi:uncharacterized protein with beta-barrel porin domain